MMPQMDSMGNLVIILSHSADEINIKAVIRTANFHLFGHTTSRYNNPAKNANSSAEL